MTSFEYSCTTANKFSFLNESEDVEDPSEILANLQAQQAKEANAAKDAAKNAAKTGEKKVTKLSQTGPGAVKKDAKKVPLQQQADNSKQAGDKSKPKTGDRERKPGQQDGRKSAGNNREPRPAGDKENTNNKERRPRPEGGFENRGGEGGFRNNGPRGPRQEGDKPFRPRPVRNDESGQQQTGEGGNFGGFRGPRQQGDRQQGRGGYRGPRRQPQDAEHVREFDRHSGSDKTGIKAVDKKDGAGKSNWGTYNDELAVEGELAAEVSEQKQDWAARVDENEENKVEGEGEDKEVAPNFMTLEEYKAIKNEIKKKNDFNIRRPGEGEDPSKWKNTYVLPKKPVEKDEEEEEEVEEEEEEDEEEIKRKQILNQIQIKFYEQPSQRDRGDRRDRRPAGPRREQTGSAASAAAAGSNTNSNSAADAPVANAEGATESSPEKQPRRDNRPPRQQGGGQQGGQRGGQRGGPRGGNFRQKEKPLNFDDKEFPSLGK